MAMTITSNDGQVRINIYEGRIPISDAAAELLRMEKAQHEAERDRHSRTLGKLIAANREIERLKSNGIGR